MTQATSDTTTLGHDKVRHVIRRKERRKKKIEEKLHLFPSMSHNCPTWPRPRRSLLVAASHAPLHRHWTDRWSRYLPTLFGVRGLRQCSTKAGPRQTMHGVFFLPASRVFWCRTGSFGKLSIVCSSHLFRGKKRPRLASNGSWR